MGKVLGLIPSNCPLKFKKKELNQKAICLLAVPLPAPLLWLAQAELAHIFIGSLIHSDRGIFFLLSRQKRLQKQANCAWL